MAAPSRGGCCRARRLATHSGHPINSKPDIQPGAGGRSHGTEAFGIRFSPHIRLSPTANPSFRSLTPARPLRHSEIRDAPQPMDNQTENNMTRITTMLERVRSGLGPRPAQLGEVKELPKQTITVAGTVETIDKNRHLLQIKTADGKFVALDVPASAKRFDELKVGDKVKATYKTTSTCA